MTSTLTTGRRWAAALATAVLTAALTVPAVAFGAPPEQAGPPECINTDPALGDGKSDGNQGNDGAHGAVGCDDDGDDLDDTDGEGGDGDGGDDEGDDDDGDNDGDNDDGGDDDDGDNDNNGDGDNDGDNDDGGDDDDGDNDNNGDGGSGDDNDNDGDDNDNDGDNNGDGGNDGDDGTGNDNDNDNDNDGGDDTEVGDGTETENGDIGDGGESAEERQPIAEPLPGDWCDAITVTFVPGQPGTHEHAVALTAQAFEQGVPAWERVTWVATDRAAVRAVAALHGDDVTLLTDGDLSTGTLDDVDELLVCAEITDPQGEGSSTGTGDDDAEVLGVVLQRADGDDTAATDGAEVLGVTLARTGLDAGWLAAVGVLALLAGGGVLAATRRRGVEGVA
jgi:hypothetical protein